MKYRINNSSTGLSIYFFSDEELHKWIFENIEDLFVDSLDMLKILKIYDEKNEFVSTLGDYYFALLEKED